MPARTCPKCRHLTLDYDQYYERDMCHRIVCSYRGSLPVNDKDRIKHLENETALLKRGRNYGKITKRRKGHLG